MKSNHGYLLFLEQLTSFNLGSIVLNKSAINAIDRMIESVDVYSWSAREPSRLIKERFGLSGEEKKTLEELSIEYGISKESIHYRLRKIYSQITGNPDIIASRIVLECPS